MFVSREWIKLEYKTGKTRDMRTKFISDMPFVNSLEGQIFTVETEIMLRWLTYFDDLLNTENARKKLKMVCQLKDRLTY